MLERIGRGAPRVRFVALVAVALVVAGLVAFAMAKDDVVARGWTSPAGRVCVDDGDRVWQGWDPVAPSGDTSTAIEGTLVATGPGTAELTTPSGRTIAVRTDQAEGEWRNDMVSCALMAA